jgi:hypothetical protein
LRIKSLSDSIAFINPTIIDAIFVFIRNKD